MSVGNLMRFFSDAMNFRNFTISQWGYHSQDINDALAVFNQHGLGLALSKIPTNTQTWNFYIMPYPNDVKQFLCRNVSEVLSVASSVFGGNFTDLNTALGAFYAAGYKLVHENELEWFILSTYTVLEVGSLQGSLQMEATAAPAVSPAGAARIYNNGSNAFVSLNGAPYVPFLTALNFYHNGGFLGAQQAIDFEDSATVVWSFVDDPTNGRTKVTGVATTGGGSGSGLPSAGSTATGYDIQPHPLDNGDNYFIYPGATFIPAVSDLGWDDAHFFDANHTTRVENNIGTGKFRIYAHVNMSLAASNEPVTQGNIMYKLKKNGTTYLPLNYQYNVQPSFNDTVIDGRSMVWEEILSLGDYLEFEVDNNTDGIIFFTNFSLMAVKLS